MKKQLWTRVPREVNMMWIAMYYTTEKRGSRDWASLLREWEIIKRAEVRERGKAWRVLYCAANCARFGFARA